MISIVYYGTGNFSAAILKAIIEADYNVLAVITQPDKKTGRKRESLSSPVKSVAEQYNLKIYQPETLKFFEINELTRADLAVVAEYGLIIPENLLSLPKKGTVNLHTSLLPKYRGASPIQEALKNGDTETGVTLMVVDKKMDHGPIIATQTITIEKNDTQADLFQKLAPVASQIFLDKTPLWINNQITANDQDHTKATYTKLLSRDDGHVDFSLNSAQIYNLWRAMTPWPGIWASHANQRIKLTKIEIAEKSNLKQGEILFENNKIYIGCGLSTSIEVLELQLQSKSNMAAKLFINGHASINGEFLS